MDLLQRVAAGGIALVGDQDWHVAERDRMLVPLDLRGSLGGRYLLRQLLGPRLHVAAGDEVQHVPLFGRFKVPALHLVEALTLE